jgi:hypothetical protein
VDGWMIEIQTSCNFAQLRCKAGALPLSYTPW